MRKGPESILAAVSTVAAVTLGLMTPALASAANSPKPTFAGYEFNNYVAVPATVSATIVVPKLSCTAGPERDIWPGVGMASVTSFVGLDMFCKNGKAHYSPFLEVQSSTRFDAAATAHPGDRIAFKVYESTAHTTGSVVDKTHAFTVTKSGAGSGTGSGPMVGDSAVYFGGTKFGVPNFGTLAFSNALASGSSSTPGPFAALGPTGYNMIAGAGGSPPTALQVQTDPFASNNESFKTVFKHS